MALGQSRALRIILVIVALGFFIATVRSHYLAAHKPSLAANTAPASGMVLYDSYGRVPGNPQNGVDGLKKMDVVLKKYLALHSGQYPTTETDLFMDLLHNAKLYGYNDPQQVFKSLSNPDDKYSDFESIRTHPLSIPYNYSSKRLDGTKIGSSKAPGTRDVLFWCGLYFHRNIGIYPHKSATERPVGFYIVFWDDGTIEQIPYNKILYVPVSNPADVERTRIKYQLGASTPIRQEQNAFPGQAGVPADAMSYEDYYKKLLHLQPPASGTPGISAKE